MNTHDKVQSAQELILIGVLCIICFVGPLATDSLLGFMVWAVSWLAAGAIPFLALQIWSDLKGER